MKKIVVVILAMALLVPLVLIAPVMAAPNEDAWRTVPVSMLSNKQVTYAQLTDYCVNVWGLSENPYPAYPTAAHTAYYVFTVQIGDDVFEGVSCNTYTAAYNPTTKVLTLTYDAVWYLGDWGKDNARMNQGFKGKVIADVYGYKSGPPPSYDYFLGSFSLEGFQRFNHQSIFMPADTRVSTLSSGLCTVLGNRDKN